MTFVELILYLNTTYHLAMPNLTACALLLILLHHIRACTKDAIARGR